MTKYDLYGDGTTIIDVEYDIFLKLLAQFTNLGIDLAHGYIVAHASGLADFDNKHFKPDMDRMRRQYSVAIDEIEDEELKNGITCLRNFLEMLSESDDKMRTAYQEMFEAKGNRSNRRLSLEKRVYRHMYEEHKPPPAIVLQIARETEKLVPELKDLKQRILDRIGQFVQLE